MHISGFPRLQSSGTSRDMSHRELIEALRGAISVAPCDLLHLCDLAADALEAVETYNSKIKKRAEHDDYAEAA